MFGERDAGQAVELGIQVLRQGHWSMASMLPSFCFMVDTLWNEGAQSLHFQGLNAAIKDELAQMDLLASSSGLDYLVCHH